MVERIAGSLEQLRAQVNELAPKRNKSSDGWIGDAAHRSRPSDHNPDSKGIVHALDLTHDPGDGVDCQKLANILVQSRDPRIKFIIWNRKICSGTGQDQPAWVWRPYIGTNPHSLHIHVSVKGVSFEDDAATWKGLEALATPLTEAASPPTTPRQPTLRRGSTDPAVALLRGLIMAQEQSLGPILEAAVKAFQKERGLFVDGVVGAYTWAELLNPEKKP